MEPRSSFIMYLFIYARGGPFVSISCNIFLIKKVFKNRFIWVLSLLILSFEFESKWWNFFGLPSLINLTYIITSIKSIAKSYYCSKVLYLKCLLGSWIRLWSKCHYPIPGMDSLVQSRQWKQRNNTWNLSTVNNKSTRTTSVTSFLCLYC